MATGAVRTLYRDEALALEVLSCAATADPAIPATAVAGPAGRHAAPGLRRAARALALARLGTALGGEPQRLVVERRCDRCGSPAHGKPRLAGELASLGDFALSYAGALALVSVVSTPGLRVGVDVEGVPDDLAVSRFCFAESERRFLERLERLEPRKAASELAKAWARKEAIAKALGLGLFLPLRRAVVTGPSASWELPDGVVGLVDVAAGPGLAAAVALADGTASLAARDGADAKGSSPSAGRASFILRSASRND